jgi:hypothetical protein
MMRKGWPVKGGLSLEAQKGACHECEQRYKAATDVRSSNARIV